MSAWRWFLGRSLKRSSFVTPHPFNQRFLIDLAPAVPAGRWRLEDIVRHGRIASCHLVEDPIEWNVGVVSAAILAAGGQAQRFRSDITADENKLSSFYWWVEEIARHGDILGQGRQF